MAKEQTLHYVGMNDQGMYWAGYNTWTDQLRKAKQYNGLRYAHEALREAVTRSNKWLDPKIKSYRILTVENVVHEVSEEFFV